MMSIFSDKPLITFAPRDSGWRQKRRRGDSLEITDGIWVRKNANISTRWDIGTRSVKETQ